MEGRRVKLGVLSFEGEAVGRGCFGKVLRVRGRRWKYRRLGVVLFLVIK